MSKQGATTTMSIYDNNADLYDEAGSVPAPTPMVHTPACLEQQRRYTDWIAQWPNACKKCGATGLIYDPGVWRRADGSGDPPSTELCATCIGGEATPFTEGTPAALLKCPRCGEHHIYVTDIEDVPDEVRCSYCGWAWTLGANVNPDWYMPEVDCSCWES